MTTILARIFRRHRDRPAPFEPSIASPTWTRRVIYRREAVSRYLVVTLECGHQRTAGIGHEETEMQCFDCREEVDPRLTDQTRILGPKVPVG